MPVGPSLVARAPECPVEVREIAIDEFHVLEEDAGELDVGEEAALEADVDEDAAEEGDVVQVAGLIEVDAVDEGIVADGEWRPLARTPPHVNARLDFTVLRPMVVSEARAE